jgi:acyl-CoA thioester hydrolase
VSVPETVSELRVRYAETDQMGVVYHTHYLVWCEIGRTDHIRSFGESYANIEERGVKLAVAEAGIRYAASARYDDWIRVRTRVERVQSRVITFTYRIHRVDENQKEVLLATAHTRLVALGGDGAPRSLPEWLQQRLREGLDSK